MDDELKKIEIETARIRLERERMAYQNELDKQNRNKRASNTAVNAINITRTASLNAASIIFIGLKYAFSALLGGAFATYGSYLWVSKNRGGSNIDDWNFNFGYWAGSGGWIFILLGAICGGLVMWLMTAPPLIAESDEKSKAPKATWKNYFYNIWAAATIIYLLVKWLG